MRPNRVMKAGGILLIFAGVAILIWAAFGFRTREKVLDIGPIEATREKTHDVPYGPLGGVVLLVGGVVMLVAARR